MQSFPHREVNRDPELEPWNVGSISETHAAEGNASQIAAGDHLGGERREQGSVEAQEDTVTQLGGKRRPAAVNGLCMPGGLMGSGMEGLDGAVKAGRSSGEHREISILASITGTGKPGSDRSVEACRVCPRGARSTVHPETQTGIPRYGEVLVLFWSLPVATTVGLVNSSIAVASSSRSPGQRSN